MHPHVHVPCGPPYRVVWLCSCTMVVFEIRKQHARRGLVCSCDTGLYRNIVSCLLNASIQFIFIFCSTRHLKAKVEQIVNEKQEKTSQINNYGFIKKRTSFFFLFCLWIMKANYLRSKKSDQGGVKAFVCGPRSISNRFLNSVLWKHDSHVRLKFQTEFIRRCSEKVFFSKAEAVSNS